MQLHFPTSLFRESLHSSETIHETGLSGNVVASSFPLIIYIYKYIIYIYINIYIYIYIYILNESFSMLNF